MRLTQRNLKTVYLRTPISVKDKQGYIKKAWTDPIPLKMTIQPAGGAVNAQIYGEKLVYMLTGKYQGQTIKAGKSEDAGLCIYVDKGQEPDYKITSIQEFSTHKNITMQKRDVK